MFYSLYKPLVLLVRHPTFCFFLSPRRQKLEAEQAAETGNGAATDARQEKEMAKAAEVRECRLNAQRERRRSSAADARLAWFLFGFHV